MKLITTPITEYTTARNVLFGVMEMYKLRTESLLNETIKEPSTCEKKMSCRDGC